VNERPILFSGEMVRAILEDRKTQTRRVIKPQPVQHADGEWHVETKPTKSGYSHERAMRNILDIYCPHGKPGDRLWVRETWCCEELESGLDGVRYQADGKFIEIENTVIASDAWLEAYFPAPGKWRPSIFMPRWASRITLEIVKIRVERVQEITTPDCYAEGCPDVIENQVPIGWYRELWNRINLQRGYSWESNPWVWVIEFKRVDNMICSRGYNMNEVEDGTK
jgi:hypothetical protein